MELNTPRQLTVEFNPQLYESSVLVFKFDPNVWPVDEVREMFNQLKTIYPNAICIPVGTDLSWMTEKEFDKWVDQVKEESWRREGQSGINS